jgi:hypothetical protein
MLDVVPIPTVYNFIRKSFPHHFVSFIADKMCFPVCRYVCTMPKFQAAVVCVLGVCSVQFVSVYVLISTVTCKNYTLFIFVTSFGRNFSHQAKYECLQPNNYFSGHLFLRHCHCDEKHALLLQ